MAQATSNQDRISKREFITRVAVRSGKPVKAISPIYEAIIAELAASVADGEDVVLTGFGRFYRQAHKGHLVRFGPSEVPDYSVLKFSASRKMNRSLDERRKAYEEEGQDEALVAATQ